MNLSLERFYRQFRETDRKVSALIGDLQSGAIPLYIATPQSEGGEGAIAQIRSTLGNIANILRDPYIILKTEMSVVRAERASALSPRGIQETVQDGRVWKKKNNDVLPEYVYAIEREDDYNTYENRMVKSLIDKAVRFLNVPMKNAKDGIPSLYEAYFQISNLNKLDWMKIMEKDIFQQNPERAFDQYSELYRLKSRLNVFRNSPFYRTMSQFPPVSGSLEMTNLLTHNEDYRRCAKLWTYLDEANAGIFTLNEQQRANAYSLFIFSGLLKAYADGGFTLHNFSYLPGYLPIFGRSFWLAFLSTVVCLALGYPMAYLMSRLSASKQSLCMMLIMLPMWINFLLRTYAWMSILENNGFINQFFRSIGLISFLQSHFGYSLDYIPLINTQGAIVLGMVYNFLPFMVLPIYTVLIKLDRKLIEAAQDLGAPTHLVFRRVIFPLSIPGVISGITMVFVPSISTFYISQKLGGGSFELIGDTIERQFVSSARNTGAAISLVMMVLILISLSIMNRFGEDDGGIVV